MNESERYKDPQLAADEMRAQLLIGDAIDDNPIKKMLLKEKLICEFVILRERTREESKKRIERLEAHAKVADEGYADLKRKCEEAEECRNAFAKDYGELQLKFDSLVAKGKSGWYDDMFKKNQKMEAVIYAVGDWASDHKDDRFGSRRRLLEAYSAYEKEKGHSDGK